MPLIPLTDEEKEAARSYTGGSSQVAGLALYLARLLKKDPRQTRQTITLVNEFVADAREAHNG